MITLVITIGFIGFGVWGFGVWGLGVWGLGFGVGGWGLGVGGWGLGFRAMMKTLTIATMLTLLILTTTITTTLGKRHQTVRSQRLHGSHLMKRILGCT